MTKAYMIAECIGDSIYEAHTLPFVYLELHFAEYQLIILQNEADKNGTGESYKIRSVVIVDEGPK